MCSRPAFGHSHPLMTWFVSLLLLCCLQVVYSEYRMQWPISHTKCTRDVQVEEPINQLVDSATENSFGTHRRLGPDISDSWPIVELRNSVTS